MMTEKQRKELRKNTMTIAISFAAMGMGLITIFITWKNNQSVWIGVIVSIGMLLNLITAVKRRREILNEINSNPRL